MADGKDTGIEVLLIVIAGLASAAISCFGLFAGAWGGFVGAPTQPISVTHIVFWLLPSLCLPAFILSWWFRRIGLLTLWMIPVGTFVALAVQSLQACAAGRCTTTNPVLIALGALIGFGPPSRRSCGWRLSVCSLRYGG